MGEAEGGERKSGGRELRGCEKRRGLEEDAGGTKCVVVVVMERDVGMGIEEEGCEMNDGAEW